MKMMQLRKWSHLIIFITFHAILSRTVFNNWLKSVLKIGGPDFLTKGKWLFNPIFKIKKLHVSYSVNSGIFQSSSYHLKFAKKNTYCLPNH